MAEDAKMINERKKPRVFRILRGEALEIRHSAFGSVGKIFQDEEIEAVWISKQNEAIDSGWFSQHTVDLIVVLQGQLRVEFEQEEPAPLILEIGDLLVLPPNTRCRACRWPRDRKEATMFFAIYPVEK